MSHIEYCEKYIKFWKAEKNYLSSIYQEIEDSIPIREKVLNRLHEQLELDKHKDDWYNTYLEKDFQNLYEKAAKLDVNLEAEDFRLSYYYYRDLHGKYFNYVDFLKVIKELIKERIETCEKNIEELNKEIEKYNKECNIDMEEYNIEKEIEKRLKNLRK